MRKTVTIVFSDLKGSTSLGEALDSESLREVMSRYFDEMREILEHHGGRVEKYIGDAIMAVFGLPRLHEDDALRAVRAAAEMKAALVEVNEELQAGWGVRLENRTGGAGPPPTRQPRGASGGGRPRLGGPGRRVHVPAGQGRRGGRAGGTARA